MNWITVLSSLFALIGVALVIAAGRQYARQRAFVRSSATTSGIVVALIENREMYELSSYFPQVTFQTSTGRKITFQSEMGSSPEARRIGDPVVVRYRRDRPDVAEIDGFMSLWGPTLLFGALGVVFLVVGLGVLAGLLPV